MCGSISSGRLEAVLITVPTSSEIIKETNISSGKIYETLEKLISKGLVKFIIENGVKNFIANEPEMLIEYIKEKEILSFTPSAILIINTDLFILSYEEELTCVYIRSKSISDSFLQFFSDLWSIAKN